jgi:hypothetical protein
MRIPTQSYEKVHQDYQGALGCMTGLGLNLSPGRAQHYERVIDYWRNQYRTASPEDAQKAFPDFVSSMFEIGDFVDIYRSFEHVAKSELKDIAEKLKKGVNGPANSASETESSKVARNFIFEALVAARCHKPSNFVEAILGSVTDTGIRVGNKKIWVECKRVTSEKKLEANVRDACNQLERVLGKKIGSGHRSLVAIDFTKLLHKGDKLLVKDGDLSLRRYTKEIMELFIHQFSNQWEKVYPSKSNKIVGTILKFSTMATSEDRNLLVRVSEWAINPRRGIDTADELMLRSLTDALEAN